MPFDMVPVVLYRRSVQPLTNTTSSSCLSSYTSTSASVAYSRCRERDELPFLLLKGDSGHSRMPCEEVDFSEARGDSPFTAMTCGVLGVEGVEFREGRS